MQKRSAHRSIVPSPQRSIVPSPQRTPKGARRDYTQITTRDLLEYWRSQRSEWTAKCYSYDVKVFARFLGFEEDTLAAVAYLLGNGHAPAEMMVADYAQHLFEIGRSAQTVNRHVAALKSLVRTAHELAPEEIPWTIHTKSLPVDRLRDTRGPGPAGVAKIIAQAEERGDFPVDLRNLALIRLLASTGLRVSEALKLDLRHVETSRARVSILGKRRKEREWITVPPQALDALTKWMEKRGREAGPLFVTYRGGSNRKAGRQSRPFSPLRRLSYNASFRALKKICIEALGQEEGERVGAHGLRHTAITLVLDLTNGDVRKAQRFSRHKSLDVLMVYDDNRTDLAGEASRMVADALEAMEPKRSGPETERQGEAGWQAEKKQSPSPGAKARAKARRRKAEAKVKVRRRRAARPPSRSESRPSLQKKPEPP